MKGFSSWLRPLAFTAMFAALAAGVVSLLIEQVYEVSLSADTFRWQRPLAGLLLLAGALVLWVRGPLRKRRAPRLLVSQASQLTGLPQGFRIWIEPALVGARVVAVLL